MRTSMNKGSRVAACIATILAAAAAGQAWADTSDLGEIVVTARKRDESFQNVPVTINVFTEQAIQSAGIEKPAGDWYVSTGQGMGEVLSMANEQQAYTLSDRGTYLSRKNLQLPVLVEGDKTLFNPYGVIAVNPIKYPTVKYDMATKFIDWITSVEGQKLIGNFKDAASGKPLFTPNSLTWKASQGKPASNLTILHAGSLANVLKDLTAAYKAKNPDANFILERGGSVDTARKISDYGRLADIMMSADYDVIDKYLIPQWASWNLKHATNSMVLAYTDQSKFGNEINANNWFDILLGQAMRPSERRLIQRRGGVEGHSAITPRLRAMPGCG